MKKMLSDSEYIAIKEEGQEESAEEMGWLITYGDMMTLLLTFFILLFSISSVDSEKYRFAMKALGDALGGTMPEEIEFEERLDQVKIEIEKIITDENLSRDMEITSDTRGIVLYARGGAFFESGDTRILEDTKIFLRKVSSILKETTYKIVIEGHTDDIPINTERFPSNWELSSGRAGNVLRSFIEEGISPARLSAVGYAQYKPRFPPTPENRAKNRRVEIIILRDRF
ncbi:MAG: flagellar motor protein MotB [Nitrospinota bacterium]